MTFVLDTREDSYGQFYESSGPYSSEQLETRRRRFSWATPVFQAITPTNNNTIKNKSSNNETLLNQSINDNKSTPIPVTDPKEINTMFESIRRGSFSKAFHFFRNLVKDTKSTKDKELKGISLRSRESLKLPKEIVEQVIKDQSLNKHSINNMDETMQTEKKWDDNKKSFDSIHSSSSDNSSLETPLESDKDNLDKLNLVKDNIKDSLSLSLDTNIIDNAHNQSFKKDSNKDNRLSKKKKDGNDKIMHRYMVNENGKIVAVKNDGSKLQSCLKKTSINNSNERKELRFKRHSQSNLQDSLSMNSKAFNQLSHLGQKLLKSSKAAKDFRFNEFVVIFETYSMEEYDRRMLNTLEANLMNTLEIKMELNEYKSKEMIVHPESRKYTHFLTV